VIKLENVNKTYKIKDRRAKTIKNYIYDFIKGGSARYIEALVDINLNLQKGERLGIIGRNGSGKSTLLSIIMGSIKPEKGGVVETNGSIMKLSLGMGMDPNLTARENIYINGSVIGLSFKAIGNIFHEIIKFADLEDFIDVPVKFFSSGMKQRLMFSIALYAKSDIFLLDEFFGGTGDKNFRIKSDIAFKTQIIENHTVVIVSHSMPIIAKYCDKAIWLDKGKIKYSGQAKKTIELYLKETENTI